MVHSAAAGAFARFNMPRDGVLHGIIRLNRPGIPVPGFSLSCRTFLARLERLPASRLARIIHGGVNDSVVETRSYVTDRKPPLTMTEVTLFLPGLSPVGGKTITATFDGGKLSSNGGVLILREIERKLGLAAVLSRHIPDDRDRTRITHSYSDMTRASRLPAAMRTAMTLMCCAAILP
jgi:Transposase DDE domain group 1